MKILFLSLPRNIWRNAPDNQMFKSPPTTHLWLSAIVRTAGHESIVIDALSQDLCAEDIYRTIDQNKPDLVGFTVFTANFYDVMFICEGIKKRFPHILTIMGGYHAHALPEDFYSEYVDYICFGEGEKTIVELMDRLDARQKEMDGIPNLIYRESNGTWCKNPASIFIPNFNDFPLIPYDMVKNNHYECWWSFLDHTKQKYMAVITGKGCPLTCSFCDIGKTEGAKYRCMDAQRVLREFEHLANLGYTHIEIRDPFFTIDTKRIWQIAEGMIEKKIQIKWGFSSTAQRIRDPKLMQLLKQAGCEFIFVGVESGNAEILKREKRITKEHVLKAIKMIQEAGIQAHCSFIFGLDGETKETLQETLDFSLELNPNTASYSIASPYPGTELFNIYKEKGYITTYNWSEWGQDDAVFETEHLSKELLKHYLKKSHRAFYFRLSYLFRRASNVQSLREFRRYVAIAFTLLWDVASYKR